MAVRCAETLRQAAGNGVAYPVAVAVAAAGHGIGERAALHAWLHAAIANQVSAAIRLVPLGQNQGQRLLAGIETQAGEARERYGDDVVARTPFSYVLLVIIFRRARLLIWLRVGNLMNLAGL